MSVLKSTTIGNLTDIDDHHLGNWITETHRQELQTIIWFCFYDILSSWEFKLKFCTFQHFLNMLTNWFQQIIVHQNSKKNHFIIIRLRIWKGKFGDFYYKHVYFMHENQNSWNIHQNQMKMKMKMNFHQICKPWIWLKYLCKKTNKLG